MAGVFIKHFRKEIRLGGQHVQDMEIGKYMVVRKTAVEYGGKVIGLEKETGKKDT